MAAPTGTPSTRDRILEHSVQIASAEGLESLTIGRLAAVADIGGLRLSGLVAWVTWLSVHLWYLVGFQNRLLVFIRWSFSFFSHGDAAWLITGADSDPACRPSGR